MWNRFFGLLINGHGLLESWQDARSYDKRKKYMTLHREKCSGCEFDTGGGCPPTKWKDAIGKPECYKHDQISWHQEIKEKTTNL